MAITFIGDVHGNFEKYVDICKKSDYTVQVGDLGFNYAPLAQLNSDYHKFFPGNHDNFTDCFKYRHCLGNYGLRKLNSLSFFFARGAISIDLKYRVVQESLLRQTRTLWWEEEELSFNDMVDCLELYKNTKPSIVVTHTCPNVVASKMKAQDNDEWLLKNFGLKGRVFNTEQLLQRMFDAHKPDLWIYGHWHKDFKVKVAGTEFVCLPELGTLLV